MLIPRLLLMICSLCLSQCLMEKESYEKLTDDYGYTIGRIPSSKISDTGSNSNNRDVKDYDGDDDDDDGGGEDSPEDPSSHGEDNADNNDDETIEFADGNDDDFLSNDESMMDKRHRKLEKFFKSTKPTDHDHESSIYKGESEIIAGQSRSSANEQNRNQNLNESQDKLSKMSQIPNVHKSMIIKVYRGPTKIIDRKPFASWGYFIKFPNT